MEKMKDQITKVIAEYLQKETLVVGEIGEQRIEFGGSLNQGHFTHEGFCSEVASEIYKSVEENRTHAGWAFYSENLRVIYNGTEQWANLRKRPSGKLYFSTESEDFISTPEVGVLIPLTRGKSVIVDVEDYHYLNQWKWQCTKHGYAARSISFQKPDKSWSSKTVFMHRVIMQTPEGLFTDHADENKLNNRKVNLRICTRSENQYNKLLRADNKSGRKGINWIKKTSMWVVRVQADKKRQIFGYFKDLEEAKIAHSKAVRLLHGEFAKVD